MQIKSIASFTTEHDPTDGKLAVLDRPKEHYRYTCRAERLSVCNAWLKHGN